MKLKPILPFFYVFLFSLSCKDVNNQLKPEYKGDAKIKTLHIDPDREKQQNTYLNSSEVFEDFELVPLVSIENVLIGEISKILESDDFFLAMDPGQDKLFIFSKDGKFLKVIDDSGRGPNEYISLDDFVIYGDSLILLSRSSESLYIYNKEGVLQKRIHLNKQFTQIEILKGKAYLYQDFYSRGGDYFNIAVFDLKSEKFVDKLSPFPKELNGLVSYGPNIKSFTSYRDTLFFTLPLSHTIFAITNGKFSPYLKVDFGMNNRVPELNESRINEIKKNNFMPNGLNRLYDLNFSDRYILFGFLYKYLKQLTIYDKKNKKVINGYVTGDKNVPFGISNPFYTKEDILITYLYSEELDSELFKEESVKQLFVKKGLSIDELSRNGNPIILKLKLK